MMQIALVLSDHEKTINKKIEENKKSTSEENIISSYAKDFKYPPVLPIVFYDGEGEWTAATNFLDRVELNDIYISIFLNSIMSL